MQQGQHSAAFQPFALRLAPAFMEICNFSVMRFVSVFFFACDYSAVTKFYLVFTTPPN
jgi:hypothetical protein